MARYNHARENNLDVLRKDIEAAYKATTIAHHEMLFDSAHEGRELRAEDEAAFNDAAAALLKVARDIGRLAQRLDAAEENDDDAIELEQDAGAVRQIGTEQDARTNRHARRQAARLGRAVRVEPAAVEVYEEPPTRVYVSQADGPARTARRAKRPGALRRWINRVFVYFTE